MSQPDETTFPRRFGEYVLVTHLGEGGMGRVYLALRRSRGKEELCVLKRFGNPRARFSDVEIAENRKRFRLEAEITMALAHPGIARSLCYSEDAEAPYLVQEFVRGVTLEFLVSSLSGYDERLPVPLAAYVVSKIADALDYMHEFRGLGLVHRDLTGSNVMFSRTGDVKVIDFGIAKATLAADSSLTRPNVLVGKPLWTAPELLGGRKADRRADIFAVGLLFWYLLTGRTPETELAKEVPLPLPSKENPEVPRHADKIIGKALATNPDERFQTAREFHEAVRDLVPSEYAGQENLAALLARNESAIEQRSFDEMVDRARPLLGLGMPSWARHWKVILPVALAVAAVGLVVGLRGSNDTQPLQTPQPAAVTEAAATASPEPSSAPPLPAPPSPGQPPQDPAPPPAPPALPKPSLAVPATAPRQRAVRTEKSTNTPPSPSLPSAPVAPTGAGARSADDLLEAALVAYSRSDRAEALQLVRDSLSIRKSADAYILLGRLFFDSDPPQAQAALEEALRLSPANREAVRLLEASRQRNP